MLVFAFPRKEIHVEVADRRPGGRVGDLVELDVRVPNRGQGRIFNVAEFDPQQLLVDVEHAGDDGFKREVFLDFLLVDGGGFEALVVVVEPVPVVDHMVALGAFLAVFERRERRDILARQRLEPDHKPGDEPLDGGRILGHALFEDIACMVLIAEQLGGFAAQREDLGEYRQILRGSAAGKKRLQPAPRGRIAGVLHERDIVGIVNGDLIAVVFAC